MRRGNVLAAQRHRQAGLVFDTNILLLFVVSRISELWIPKVKRLQAQGFRFETEDARWIRDFSSRFRCIWTTPHILTEFNNLTENLDRHLRDFIWREVQKWASVDAEPLRESRKPFRELGSIEAYLPFGVADAALVALAQQNRLVLTIDRDLSKYLEESSLPVLNYNYIRQERLGLYEG